jgi:hypothetical protein
MAGKSSNGIPPPVFSGIEHMYLVLVARVGGRPRIFSAVGSEGERTQGIGESRSLCRSLKNVADEGLNVISRHDVFSSNFYGFGNEAEIHLTEIIGKMRKDFRNYSVIGRL